MIEVLLDCVVKYNIRLTVASGSYFENQLKTNYLSKI